MMNQIITSIAILLLVSTSAMAQVANDDDNAGRSVYDDGIVNFENGSTTGSATGLGNWVFGGNVTVGDDFTAVASNNGGATSIDTSGRSFRLVDQSVEGSYIDVFRYLEGGNLGVGQTFSVQLDVNFRDGYKGIRVRDSDDSTSLFRFEVGNQGSGDDYSILDSTTGNGSIGSGYSDDSIFTISLEQTSLSGGNWSVNRSGGIADLDTGTFSGQVSSFQFYNTGTNSSANENALLFNNLQIIPEPGTFMLMLIGSSVMVAVGLRRRHSA